MKKVYFFPSGNAVFNDKILPIILELARQGNAVDTIFLDFKAYQALGVSGLYYEWLRGYTRLRRLIVKERWKFLDKVIFLLRYILLMIEMWWSRGCAFFDTKSATWVTAALSRIAKQRGQSILFTPAYVDVWGRDIDWKKVVQNKDRAQKLGKSTHPKPAVYKYCTKVLLYNQNMAGDEQEIGCKEYRIVPHPKLQRWWKEFLINYPPIYDDALKTVDACISVFLTYKGNYFFRADSDLDILIKEIIQSVRKVFPEIFIVLKPKASLLRHSADWLANYIREFNDPRIVITDTPVALLALRSLAGITTGHTTAQFEFMVGDAPWIEYCRYSDFWKEIYHRLTYTENYGGSWAQTPEELTGVLQKLKGGQLKTDREAFKRAVNFFEQDISLDFFAK